MCYKECYKFYRGNPVGRDEGKKKVYGEGYGVPMLQLGMIFSGNAMCFMNIACGWFTETLVISKIKKITVSHLTFIPTVFL